MKTLQAYARAQRKPFTALCITALLIGLMIIAQAYLVVSIIEPVFLREATLAHIKSLLVILLIVFLLRIILTYLHSRIGYQIGASVKDKLRNSLLTYYVNNPISSTFKSLTGKKVSIMMEGVEETEPYFSKYIPQQMISIFVPLIILGAVFWQNWPSGVIMLLTAPLIPLFMIAIGKKTEQKAEQQLEQLKAFSGRFLDSLQGLLSLKLFGKAKSEKERIRESSLAYRDATMDVLKFAFLSSLLLELISMLGIALVAVEVGLRLVIYQNISFFSALFVLFLAPEYFKSLKDLGSAFHAGRGSIGAYQGISKELEGQPAKKYWGKGLLPKHNPPVIELQNITFSYEKNAFEEKGFCLEKIKTCIPPYSQVAIVGPSGSGKTTLLHLISGLYQPIAGEILINGQSLSHFQEKEWYSTLIYISQDPYLFSGTIAENILIANQSGHVSDKLLSEALEKAGLNALIDELEHGINTTIGEGGRGLSGGEKQRIALARAFIRKPSIILFDEPTVGLDLETEHILQQAIQELAQTATIITVAHRLHTIKHADRILFLSNGTLKAQGTHEELLLNAPEYQLLFKAHQRGAVG